MDKTKYSNIKLIILSVDGVFTSGKAAYDYEGRVVSKVFLDKDFIALSKLRKFFNIVIISSEEHINSGVFEQKEFKFYYSKNKKKTLKQVLRERNTMPDECIYVGDDLLDLPCVRLISCSFCPVDAFEEVRNVATILSIVGGDGVVYELYRILSEEIAVRYKFYK
jgi:3-deoxy-D-manno-octulosonate 8-phosphate phosphatase (KDO 8-P phosphatase)